MFFIVAPSVTKVTEDACQGKTFLYLHGRVIIIRISSITDVSDEPTRSFTSSYLVSILCGSTRTSCVRFFLNKLSKRPGHLLPLRFPTSQNISGSGLPIYSMRGIESSGLKNRASRRNNSKLI